MGKPLKNVKDIASYLNVSPKTLYQWAELRQIPHVKLNGCLRFDQDSIDKWIEDCKNGPDAGK